MTDVSLCDLLEERAQLQKSIDEGSLNAALLKTAEAQVKRLDTKITKLRGKKVTLPDGGEVEVGSKVWTFRAGYRSLRMSISDRVLRRGGEWKPPVIADHVVKAISPTGRLAISKYDNTYISADGRFDGSPLFSSRENAVKACIEHARELVNERRREYEKAIQRVEDSKADYESTRDFLALSSEVSP